MFIGYQGELAAFIANTREELINSLFIELSGIKEVPFAEMFNGVIYTSEEELIQAKSADVRTVRNSYLEKYVDPKQLVMVWESLSEDDKQMYTAYRQYLLDYTSTENWYLNYPMTLEDWKISYEIEEAEEEPSVEPVEGSNNEVVEPSEAGEDVVELYSMEI